MEFPRLVFKDGGPHDRHKGSYSTKLVEDEDEYSEALNDGWYASIPEAIENKHDESTEKALDIADATRAPSREELETMAKELELKFDGRTSDAKLSSMIDKELKEKKGE